MEAIMAAAVAKRLTKAQIIGELAEKTGVSKKDVVALMTRQRAR